MTDGKGVDMANEAVGIRPRSRRSRGSCGGQVAKVGVHGASVQLALQDLWIKALSINTGLVSASTTPVLLKLVAQHKPTVEKFATHHFGFGQMMGAYDTSVPRRSPRP